MKISLLHPSRGRAIMAAHAYTEWATSASGKHTIEYILSVDTDDPYLPAYKTMFPKSRVLMYPNRSIVDAVNRAAEECTGDIIIVMSDDFDCPRKWDQLIIDALEGFDDAVLLVNDGLGGRLVTLPILTRKYYERLGYIYYPEYFSMFCDTELTFHAEQMQKMVDARYLVFKHKHYSAGLSPIDDTYRRENSKEAWAIGEKIFNERKQKGFPPYAAVNTDSHAA